jgi:hypothetical protein
LIRGSADPGCEGGQVCNSAPYEFWLYYDEQGFRIRYVGTVELSSSHEFCPTFRNDGNLGGSIRIYLKAPDDEVPFEQHMSLSYPLSLLQKTKDLVELTGMSMEEFAERLQQPGPSFCFSTPRDIWP